MKSECGQTKPEAAVLAEAVQKWFEFYDVDPTPPVDKMLCRVAMRIFRDGYRSVDEIATVLIATYVGELATRINAPTSASIN